MRALKAFLATTVSINSVSIPVFQTKKTILIKPIIGLLFAGFWIAQSICIASAATREIQKSPVRVNWIGNWFREDFREYLVREIAREYRFLYPEIQVNLRFPEELFGMRNRHAEAKLIIEMIRSGDIEWDIVWIDNQIYRYVAESLGDWEWGRKHLVNFLDVPGFPKTQKPFIVDNPIYRNQTGGILVGPYIEGYYMALWYNKAVALKIGTTIKARGMLFDDLLKSVKQLYQHNQRNGEYIAAFYESNNWTTTEHLFQNLVKSALLDFEDVKSETGSRIKDAALLKTLAAFETLGHFNPLIDSHKNNSWFETRHLPLDGKVLYYINGTWMYSHWRGIDPEKLKNMMPVELPVFQPVDYALGGYVPTWGVMKKSPQRNAAIQLLLWASRSRIAEKWVRYTKSPTGLRGNLSQIAFGVDAFDRFIWDMANTYRSRVHFSSNPGYVLGQRGVRLGKLLETTLLEVLSGAVTAQDAYRKIMNHRDRPVE